MTERLFGWVLAVCFVAAMCAGCGGESFGQTAKPGKVGFMVLQTGLQIDVRVIDGPRFYDLSVGQALDGYARTPAAVQMAVVEIRPKLAGGLTVVGDPDPIVRTLDVKGDSVYGIAVVRRTDDATPATIEDADLVLVDLTRR